MCCVGSGLIVLRKLRFASSRFSAGDDTESASVLCERPDRPRVKSGGRAAMVATGYMQVFKKDKGRLVEAVGYLYNVVQAWVGSQVQVQLDGVARCFTERFRLSAGRRLAA